MFSKIAHFFGKLFGSVPSWSQKASTAISYIAPLTNTIVALAAGDGAAAQATQIVHEVQSDLATAAAFLSQAHGTADAPAGLYGALEAVNGNLKALLAAGHIKNPDTLAKVTAVANTIVGEIEAVLSSLPKPAAATVIATA